MIVADDAIPYLDVAFGSENIRRVRGAQIKAAHLVDATALLVRSVTRVDAALLGDSPVRFVGSATAGTDHIARSELSQLGVEFAHAPGCNARAVTEYVLTAMLAFGGAEGPIGVVGFGQIGQRLTTALRRLRYQVLVCDPPRASAGCRKETYVELETLLAECKTVTLHVPKIRTGPHTTSHLLDASGLARLPKGALLINTSRGDVIDNAALEAWLDQDRGTAVLDVWEGEPHLRSRLYDHAAIRLATPHIAGYTVEGKARGTKMIHDAYRAHLGGQPTFEDHTVLRPLDPLPHSAGSQSVLRALHPLHEPDAALRRLRVLSPHDRGPAFEALRRAYPLRRELSAVSPPPGAVELFDALRGLS